MTVHSSHPYIYYRYNKHFAYTCNIGYISQSWLRALSRQTSRRIHQHHGHIIVLMNSLELLKGSVIDYV